MIKGGKRTKALKKSTYRDNPKVTVITVVFNCAESIEETIKSVANQTYDNIEYIIIDGGSHDGTLDIIKQYEDKINYWQSEPDNGIYDAMNKGISFATGDWINFMNAGDIFCNNKVIKDVVDNILQNPSLDIIYGKAIDKENEEIKQYPPTKINFFLERTLCHQSVFAKRIAFQNSFFDISYKIIADRVWLYNCKKNKLKFGKIDNNIVVYDQTGVSQNFENYSMESYRFQLAEFGRIGVFFITAKRVLKHILFQ